MYTREHNLGAAENADSRKKWRQIEKNYMEEFIKEYLNRGFGSMNKNDFEVFIFNELLKTKLKGKSNFEISLILKIQESKVKRLRYEAALKFPQAECNLKTMALKALETVTIENERIIFQTENILLKSYISSLMKSRGKTCDSSYNQEIIVIRLEDYEILINELYDSKFLDENLNKMKKNTGNDKLTWLDVLKNSIPQAVGAIINILPQVITAVTHN